MRFLLGTDEVEDTALSFNNNVGYLEIRSVLTGNRYIVSIADPTIARLIRDNSTFVRSVTALPSINWNDHRDSLYHPDMRLPTVPARTVSVTPTTVQPSNWSTQWFEVGDTAQQLEGAPIPRAPTRTTAAPRTAAARFTASVATARQRDETYQAIGEDVEFD